ncbi:hypothetical protein BsWGS_01612 [Bradybaena similaris]
MESERCQRSESRLNQKEIQAIKEVISKVKSAGLFDQFRKECLADVDTKPAYHNLIQRVEKFVERFLNSQKWSSDLNKKQLRETLRRQLNNSGVMNIGVDRIIEQVVNPKILLGIKPKIDEAICDYFGINLNTLHKEQQRRKQQHQQCLLQHQQFLQNPLHNLMNQHMTPGDAFGFGSGMHPTMGTYPWLPTSADAGFHGTVGSGMTNTRVASSVDPTGISYNPQCFGGMMQPYYMGGWMPGMESFSHTMPPVISGQPLMHGHSMPAYGDGNFSQLDVGSAPFSTTQSPSIECVNTQFDAPPLSIPPPCIPQFDAPPLSIPPPTIPPFDAPPLSIPPPCIPQFDAPPLTIPPPTIPPFDAPPLSIPPPTIPPHVLPGTPLLSSTSSLGPSPRALEVTQQPSPMAPPGIFTGTAVTVIKPPPPGSVPPPPGTVPVVPPASYSLVQASLQPTPAATSVAHPAWHNFPKVLNRESACENIDLLATEDSSISRPTTDQHVIPDASLTTECASNNVSATADVIEDSNPENNIHAVKVNDKMTESDRFQLKSKGDNESGMQIQEMQFEEDPFPLQNNFEDAKLSRSASEELFNAIEDEEEIENRYREGGVSFDIDKSHHI